MTERRVYRGAETKTFGKLGGFRNLLTWQRPIREPSPDYEVEPSQPSSGEEATS